jgi:hypothetical protein
MQPVIDVGPRKRCWQQIFQSEGGRQTVLKWLAVADAAASAEMLQAMVGAHVTILPLSLEACGVLCARDDQDLIFPVLSALMGNEYLVFSALAQVDRFFCFVLFFASPLLRAQQRHMWTLQTRGRFGASMPAC